MLILTDEQQVSLSLEAKTAAGNPANLDGAPVWSSSNTDVLFLEVSEDGLTAKAVTTGQLGTVQVSVTADADLDVGEVRELVAVLDVTVVAAEAVSLGIAAGTPEVIVEA
jgi:hypothetical protein